MHVCKASTSIMHHLHQLAKQSPTHPPQMTKMMGTRTYAHSGRPSLIDVSMRKMVQCIMYTWVGNHA